MKFETEHEAILQMATCKDWVFFWELWDALDLPGERA
jgi:hypothetical protein